MHVIHIHTPCCTGALGEPTDFNHMAACRSALRGFPWGARTVSYWLPGLQKKMKKLSSPIMRFHPDAHEVIYLNNESWTLRKITILKLGRLYAFLHWVAPKGRNTEDNSAWKLRI